MARMKFLCDAERCIECNGCVTACKQENDVPWGVNRRRVVTINDGVPGERSISVACMHCSDARAWRCVRWTALPQRGRRRAARQGPVHRAATVSRARSERPVPAGGRVRRARQDGQVHVLRGRTGEGQLEAEFKKYGRNRLAEGKLPACAEMCSTKALLGGDGDTIAEIYRQRATTRGKGSEVWGWSTAYGRPEAPKAPAAPAAVPGGKS